MLSRSIASACAMVVATSGVLSSSTAQPFDSVQGRPPAFLVSEADRLRVDRAIAISTERYNEWLGPASGGPPPFDSAQGRQPTALRQAWWPSPASMELESQVAAVLARARFARLAGTTGTQTLLDGIAWHLQSRVVEELFDYAQHQPGHHADEVRLFGDHVRWGFPLLVLSKDARDERVSGDVAHAAAAVATLERVVGWPALAGALRVLASDPRPSIDRAAAVAILESALAVPLDWFVTALESGSTNYSLQSVVSQPGQCAPDSCVHTTITVAREGPPVFPDPAQAPRILIGIDFGSQRRSILHWSGIDSARSFTIESASAPLFVTLDPDRLVRLDDNPIDQRWRADRTDRRRPVKLLASWIVWLQNAVLTGGVLL